MTCSTASIHRPKPKSTSMRCPLQRQSSEVQTPPQLPCRHYGAMFHKHSWGSQYICCHETNVDFRAEQWLQKADKHHKQAEGCDSEVIDSCASDQKQIMHDEIACESKSEQWLLAVQVSSLPKDTSCCRFASREDGINTRLTHHRLKHVCVVG